MIDNIQQLAEENDGDMVKNEEENVEDIVKYEEYADPVIEPTDPDSVIVQMLAAPIHPSHINTIQGTYPIRPKSFPAVGGAEGIGKVIKVGANFKGKRPTFDVKTWSAKIDGIAMFLFLSSYVLFNGIYWALFLSTQ